MPTQLGFLSAKASENVIIGALDSVVEGAGSRRPGEGLISAKGDDLVLFSVRTGLVRYSKLQTWTVIVTRTECPR